MNNELPVACLFILKATSSRGAGSVFGCRRHRYHTATMDREIERDVVVVVVVVDARAYEWCARFGMKHVDETVYVCLFVRSFDGCH